jgi:voltage-gated potassium channel Kch
MVVNADPIRVAPRKRPPSLLLTWLYLRMLFYEFRWSLFLLVTALLLGASVISMSKDPSTGRHVALGIAFYDSWMSLLVQPYLDPTRWYVAAIHMLYPILGFSVIGEGIVRLALLMVSKRQGEKEWMRVMASTYRNHVILCGLGHLGIRVLQQLLAQQMDVVVLERNENGKFVSQGKALGVPILHRDMKDDDALVDAGIKHARSILLCTNDDMANLEAALDARRLNAKVRVVMRLFEQELAGKISGALTIDAVFSASTLAAPMVAAISLGSKVLASMSIGGVPYAASEMLVDPASGLIGKTVGQVEETMGARALALLRDGHHVAPPLAMHDLKNGDTLIMCAPTRNLAALTSTL